MYKKHNTLLTALLLVGSYDSYALGLNGDVIETNGNQTTNKPVAKDDYISTVIKSFTTATGNVSSNDLYGTSFTLIGSWVGKYGLITSFDSQGNYTYEIFGDTTNESLPASGIGTEHFEYSYSNDRGFSDTAKLVIDVHTNHSQPPVANDDHISAVVGTYTSLEGDVSINDRYGVSFSLNESWVGEYGVITSFDAEGKYTYELNQGTDNDDLPSSGTGTDSFKYTYFNADGVSANARLIIDINANTTQPEAKDDHNSAVVGVSTTATGNVGINDRHGATFTIEGSKVGRYGLLGEFSILGEYTYILFETTNSTSLPDSGQGTDSFEYTYTNNNGITDTAKLFIDVSANPAQPIAEDDYNSTIAGISTSATGNVGTNDRYGDSFSLNDSKVGQYGILSSFSSTGEYIYDLFESTDNTRLPTEGEATEHFEYTYTSLNGLTDTAFLILDVAPNPNQPIANDDYISTVAGVYTLAEGNVSTNDRYGSIFTLDESWIGQYGLITSFDSEGKYTYELYQGTDNNSLPFRGVGEDRFQYTYANANGSFDKAWVIIDISSNITLPIAADDFNFTFIGAEPISGNVTLNDRYGISVTLSNSVAGQYGTLTTFSPEGEYVYTPYQNPDSSFSSGSRTDQFLYTYVNEQGFTSGATLFINVSANPIQPKEPIANDDHISTVVGVYTVATGSTSGNDFYGSSYSLDVSWLGQYGAITSFSSTGEFTYELYENTTINNLPADGVGIDSFTYTYSNEDGLSDTARIVIDVRSNPSQPIAIDDYISTIVNTFTSVSANVSSNDLYGTIFNLPGSWVGLYGTITSFNSAGEFSYELFESTNNASLPANGVGIDKFEYTYANAKGLTDTASIIIDVNPDPTQSSLPIANNDHASVVITAHPTASGNVIDNDLNGNTITFDGSASGKYGFLNSDSSGAYTYELFSSTVNADLPVGGVDTENFAYTLINEDGVTANAVLTIDVNADPAFSGGSESPAARDDITTYISNKTISLTGDVTLNDTNGDYVILTSPPSTQFGRIVLQSDGTYVYELYETALSVIRLKAGEVVRDEFGYEYFSNAGESATAKLIIQIIGNPIDGNGNTIFENPVDEPYDNVDVEFNNRSAQATPLNSNRNIQGHLHDSNDKDWYFLTSEGDEIITLEVCPKGTSCHNKKSWVLYVFDSDLITPEIEERLFTFSRWVSETGTDKDLLGNVIIDRVTAIPSTSNHMYLAYRQGFFEEALIGVVDPCFDSLNAVDIGVATGARNYFIAISSTLAGTDNKETDETNRCGAGSVLLTRPDIPAAGLFRDNIGVVREKSYATTAEYISSFPNSDDQYAIKITSTGLAPLQSETAAANSATFDSSTGTLAIPKVRVNDQEFEATLNLQPQQARDGSNTLKFILSDFSANGLEGIISSYRATFNSETNEVLIPRVTDTNTGNAYSVILLFHPASNGNPAWLEVTSIIEI